MVKKLDKITLLFDFQVYVENIPSTSNHDTLKEIFSRFGNVEYVSLPKFKTTGDIKGFAFVEFADEESARRACAGEDPAQKDATTVLPEVKEPAVLPRMNRAMAALAKEKSEERTPDAAEEEEREGSSPAKRRRTFSEG